MKEDILDSSTDSADQSKTTSAEQPQPDVVPFEAEEIPIVEKAPQEPDTVPEEKEELPLDEMK